MTTPNSHTCATKTVQLRRTEPKDVEKWHDIRRYGNPRNDPNHRRPSDVAVQELLPWRSVASFQRNISRHRAETNKCSTDRQSGDFWSAVSNTDG